MRERLLRALKLARWALEVVRLVIVGVQSVIDAVLAALEGRPKEE